MGKSYTAMSLGLKINAAQGLDQPPYIFFDLKLVLKCLADGFFVPGSVIIIDEAGLMANSRTFMKQENVILSKVCQSFRYLNLVTFFCVPQFSFVDVAIQRLVHCHLKMVRIIKSKNKALVKPSFIMFDEYRKKKIQTKFLPITTAQEKNKIGLLAVPKPPKELTDMYEKLKDTYLKSEYKSFLDKFNNEANLNWLSQNKAITEYLSKKI